MPSPGTDGAPHSLPMIAAENLGRRYETSDGPVVALAEVDLQILSGQIAVVVGRSGSGKTTLLTLMGLLEQPGTGRIRLGAHDITNCPADRLAKLRRGRIGYLFQDAGLIANMSVIESVMLPMRYAGTARRERRPRAIEALGDVAMADKAHRIVNTLSGGERQRTGLARALAFGPEILICDEPTAALDEATSLAVAERLRAAADRGIGVLIATHDPLLRRIADRVVTLEAGRIVDGPRAHVLA